MKKVPVVIMVDPEVGAQIKPFAAELATAPKAAPEGAEDSTMYPTGSINPYDVDWHWDF